MFILQKNQCDIFHCFVWLNNTIKFTFSYIKLKYMYNPWKVIKAEFKNFCTFFQLEVRLYPFFANYLWLIMKCWRDKTMGWKRSVTFVLQNDTSGYLKCNLKWKTPRAYVYLDLKVLNRHIFHQCSFCGFVVLFIFYFFWKIILTNGNLSFKSLFASFCCLVLPCFIQYPQTVE